MKRLAVVCAWVLAVTAIVHAQSPDEDPRATLLAMGEAIESLQSYETVVRRVAEVNENATEAHAVESVTELAWARPNRVRSISTRPEGQSGVVSDGELLRVWSEPLGTAFEQAAPATLAGIDEAARGTQAEGLAVAGLFFMERPVDALVAEFREIHDLGSQDADGRDCRVVGLENDAGLRLVLWIDRATWLPVKATVDASPVLRDWATAENVSSRGARVTVTETHEQARVNPTDIAFDVAPPEGLSLEPREERPDEWVE